MQQLNDQGYQIIPTIFDRSAVNQLLHLIQTNSYNDGFGIREFLPNNPGIVEELRRNSSFGSLLRVYLTTPTCVRSIYFDKPPKANWVVGWHQDLTMNLRSLPERSGWQNVRMLKDRIVAQPPLRLLEQMVTIRIHLDDTDSTNGALRVVPGVHQEGIIRTDDLRMETVIKVAVTCQVPRGGGMLMKPLTLHASRRSMGNHASRRVIHLEFANQKTVEGLDLQEAIPF
jgi:hypothetical protein